MLRKAKIELAKEEMKFSIGHFTVFSSTSRENLHGHNYNVGVEMTTLIGDEGLSFDYRFYKEKFCRLCDTLNETVIIPALCKYLKIEIKEKYIHIFFNDEEMIFLKRDVKLLPINNVTVEELSYWLLEEVKKNQEELEQNQILEITIKVSSAPGQSGSAHWQKSSS